MKRWLIWIILLVLLGLITLGIYAWVAAPQAGNFSPPTDANDVPVRSSLQITFSQPMRAASVESRLITDPLRTGTYTWDDDTLTFTPDLPWPGGVQVQVRLRAGGRAEGGLGLPVWQEHAWSFTTAQALLAYLWPSYGPSDLYILDPLSGEVRRLTEGAGVLDYSISRDGLSIYFSGANPQAGADLFHLDLLQTVPDAADPAQPQRLLACQHVSCRSPQISPDGKWLAYERIEPGGEGSAQVWLLDLDSHVPSPIGGQGHLTEKPSWSAGNLLAYYDRQLMGYVMRDVQGGQPFVAPNSTGEPGVWAPDGSAFIAPEIIYVQTADEMITLGSSHLIRYTPFGPTLDLTQAENLEDTAPAYSPDSQTIAFARKYLDEPRWSFGRQLWMMNADGSQPRQITQDDLYNHFDISWSWDGRWLTYVRFENASYSGQSELWLRDADGTNPVQLNFGGYSPQWIP